MLSLRIQRPVPEVRRAVIMMDMKLNSGSFVIDDDGKTTVSKDIADQIEQGYEVSDAGEKKKPEFEIKDER